MIMIQLHSINNWVKHFNRFNIMLKLNSWVIFIDIIRFIQFIINHDSNSIVNLSFSLNKLSNPIF